MNAFVEFYSESAHPTSRNAKDHPPVTLPKGNTMADTITAREHLDWATERAMQYFDAGDKTNAFASFLSDVGKHDGTAWIQTHPMTFAVLEDGHSRGRDAFKAAMNGFSV